MIYSLLLASVVLAVFPGLGLVPLSAECKTFVDQQVLAAYKKCTLKEGSLELMSAGVAFSGPVPGVSTAAAFCTSECASAQKSVQQALGNSACKDALVFKQLNVNVTLSDTLKGLEASFAYICTPTQNGKSYCMDVQIEALKKINPTQVANGSFAKDLVCNDCYQRQIDQVSRVPNLPLLYQNLVNSANRAIEVTCKNTDLKVIEGTGKGVALTSLTGTTGSAYKLIPHLGIVISLIYLL